MKAALFSFPLYQGIKNRMNFFYSFEETFTPMLYMLSWQSNAFFITWACSCVDSFRIKTWKYSFAFFIFPYHPISSRKNKWHVRFNFPLIPFNKFTWRTARSNSKGIKNTFSFFVVSANACVDNFRITTRK